jgi:hypothetical protein
MHQLGRDIPKPAKHQFGIQVRCDTLICRVTKSKHKMPQRLFILSRRRAAWLCSPSGGKSDILLRSQQPWRIGDFKKPRPASS